MIDVGCSQASRRRARRPPAPAAKAGATGRRARLPRPWPQMSAAVVPSHDARPRSRRMHWRSGGVQDHLVAVAVAVRADRADARPVAGERRGAVLRPQCERRRTALRATRGERECEQGGERESAPLLPMVRSAPNNGLTAQLRSASRVRTMRSPSAKARSRRSCPRRASGRRSRCARTTRTPGSSARVLLRSSPRAPAAAPRCDAARPTARSNATDGVDPAADDA